MDQKTISEMENGDDRRAGQIDKVAVPETVSCEERVKNLLLQPILQDLEGDNQGLRVISIVNGEATGKTTLARSVYATLDVKRWFAYRAWIRVQDNFAVADVLVDILRRISTRELKEVDLADEKELSRRLHAYFFKHRYLVVLDSINSVDLTAKVLRFLVDSSNGSRVIITTRNVDLPDLIDPWVVPIKFDPLTEQVRMKPLLWCYGELCPTLRSCILYICQFPREYEIPTRRLLRLWLAEKLMPASDRAIQDAEECFLELVRMNTIHVVSRCKGHGFAKTCRLPGFIYDFLLPKALQSGFFSYSNWPNEDPKFVAPRIVVDKHSGVSSGTQEQFNGTRYNAKQICSYISFNTNKVTMQKRELDIFFNPKGEKSKLEVIDLEGVYKPVLPKNLGKVLLSLKYLGLRWTTIDELPKSVGDLPCLETLDVKHTNITKVPSSIWTKKSLHHLYLNEVSFDVHRWRLLPSSKLPKANSLQTLCGLHIEGNGPIFYLLSKLTGITKLSLTCSPTVVNKVMERIKGLTTLKTLRLKSKDLLGQPSKLQLDDMNGLVSLSKLYLFGNLNGNNLLFLPKSLKSLTLSMSFLEQFDVLEMLECLTELRLYAFSYNGKTLTCAGGMFPQLRTLKLWKLGNLESLTVESEAMPCLEELDVRDCQKLREIKLLGDKKKLKEVSLVKVKEELAQRLKARLGPSVIITKELVASAAATEVH